MPVAVGGLRTDRRWHLCSRHPARPARIAPPTTSKLWRSCRPPARLPDCRKLIGLPCQWPGPYCFAAGGGRRHRSGTGTRTRYVSLQSPSCYDAFKSLRRSNRIGRSAASGTVENHHRPRKSRRRPAFAGCGSRYTMLAMLADNMSEAEILEDFPNLRSRHSRPASLFGAQREHNHYNTCRSQRLLLDENLSRRLVPFCRRTFPGSSQVSLGLGPRKSARRP